MQWLRDAIPDVFVEAFVEAQTSSHHSTRIGTTDLLRMVPVESALRGFFKPVAKAVHARLRRTKCIPFVVDDNGTEVDGSCLDLPSRVVMASDTVREVVPPELLFNLMSKRYIREGVNVPSEVASELRIETIAVRDTHILFACLHCRLWYDFGSYVQYMFNSRNLESAILVFLMC